MLSLLLLLPAFAFGADTRSLRSIKQAPSRWTLEGRAQPTDELELRLALPAADPSALETTLYAVSNPDSDKYGQYLSREEAGALVAPKKETSDAVSGWLAKHNLTGSTTSTVGGDMLLVKTTVATAEQLLAPAQYGVYKSDAGVSAIRTLSYGLPSELNNHVDFIHPTSIFPPPSPKARPQQKRLPEKREFRHRKRASTLDFAHKCAAQWVPECAREIYKIGNRTVTKRADNAINIFSDGGHVKNSDVSSFLKKFVPQFADTQISVISVDGGAKTNGGSGVEEEADLDVDTIMGLTLPGTSNLAIANSKKDFLEELLAFAQASLDEQTPPSVLSISYGEDEAFFTNNAAELAAAKKACQVWGQLGTRGTSTLVSSGDGGVTGGHGGNCAQKKFRPTFPASCPFVTTVGATRHAVEKVAHFSGSGFSDVFEQPAYQSDVVASYLKEVDNGGVNAGRFNAKGRAYPDVAAFGVNFVIAFEGQFSLVAGTSASAPTFASVVTHLNDVQLAAGKKTLGFLNPWLYSKANAAFTDITEGFSKDCKNIGFNATTGWDLASGWGTPLFDKLQAALP